MKKYSDLAKKTCASLLTAFILTTPLSGVALAAPGHQGSSGREMQQSQQRRPSTSSNRSSSQHRPDMQSNRGPSNRRPDMQSNRGPSSRRPDMQSNRGPSQHRPDWNRNRGPAQNRPDWHNNRGPSQRPDWHRDRRPSNRRPGPPPRDHRGSSHHHSDRDAFGGFLVGAILGAILASGGSDSE